MTAEELQALEDAYRDAAGAAETARQARNEGVRQAVREGWSHARIARALGLSRARVGQMALKDR